MKKFYTLLILFFSVYGVLNAQIVITEIMYNPPESGQDSLEYIEIYNSTDADIDLSGYYFLDGIEFVFDDSTIIAAKSYMVIATDDDAIENVFGLVDVEDWETGGLSNGGDKITLADSSGNVVASVEYSDGGDWPSEADGEGYSLEICDLNGSQSDAANWSLSKTVTGVTINGYDLYASPGAANESECQTTGGGEEYPFRLISEMTTEDDNGIADSIDVKCSLAGRVEGPNFNSGGLQIIIQGNESVGITVYSGDSLGYEPQLGDEVIVQGTIGQYNGLTEMYADTIFVTSSGNDIYGPVVVGEMNENNESTLVTFEGVHVVDPSEWQTGGSFNVTFTDGVDTFEMRIDSDVGFDGLEAPEGTFNLTGLVGQFDSSEPYLDGYQVFPRSPEDIDPYKTGGGGGTSYPEYDIEDVTGTDENGVADSVGVQCELEGIVIRGDLRGDGYQFVMTNENNTAGITVFGFSTINGFEPQSGDIVEVKGTISQFNGLIEIEVDSIELQSSSNALPDPIVVEELSDSTESRYITLVNVRLDTLGPWLGDGSSFNVTVISESGNFYIMRIDSDAPLADEPVDPVQKSWDGLLAITGVGGQFDSEEPYDGGFQVFPFELSDIQDLTSLETIPESVKISVYPNPVSSILTINSDVKIENLIIYNTTGKRLDFMKVNTRGTRIDVTDLLSGIYLIYMNTEKGIAVKKFIKK